MKKADLESGLKDSILQLERKRAEEELLLKQQFHSTIDSFKPINLIKSTFNEAVTSRELKGDILTTSVGLTAGFLAKIAFAGVMRSPLRRLIGNVLMFGITDMAARNPEAVKSLGKGFFNMIRRKRLGGKNR